MLSIVLHASSGLAVEGEKTERNAASTLASLSLEYPPSLRGERERTSSSPQGTVSQPPVQPERASQQSGVPVSREGTSLPPWQLPGDEGVGAAFDLEAAGRRIIVGTLLVLVAAVVTLVMGRRLLAKLGPVSGAAGRIQLVETYPLGRQSAIKLISVDEQRFLLAIDGRSLKSLVPLNESFASALGEVDEVAEGQSEIAPAQASAFVAS